MVFLWFEVTTDKLSQNFTASTYKIESSLKVLYLLHWRTGCRHVTLPLILICFAPLHLTLIWYDIKYIHLKEFRDPRYLKWKAFLEFPLNLTKKIFNIFEFRKLKIREFHPVLEISPPIIFQAGLKFNLSLYSQCDLIKKNKLCL